MFETFAVVVARLWSEVATDPELRRVYRRIAEDELRHAQLAWDRDARFQNQLNENERNQLAQARTQAMHSLHRRAHALVVATQVIAPVDIASTGALVSAFVQHVA